MRHRIAGVIITVRRTYTGPEHVHMPPGARSGTCFDGRRPQAAKVVATKTAH
jgi:hypothetical protein